MEKKVKRTVRLNITFRDTQETPTDLAEGVRRALRTAGVSEFTVSPNLVLEETRYLFSGEEE